MQVKVIGIQINKAISRFIGPIIQSKRVVNCKKRKSISAGIIHIKLDLLQLRFFHADWQIKVSFYADLFGALDQIFKLRS